jgi:glycosyltransferase involved in cell wall biosynthesis
MNNQSYPKISLVTACFNHEKYIGETIESILSQNYPNLQYIVIDDGSTDNSWKVIEKYKDRLFHCERMEGYRKYPTIALNYGFAKTNGEIMGFLNSDDILLPKSLFTIAKLFQENQKAEWLTGLSTTINSRAEITCSDLRPKSVYDFMIGDWNVIQQESTFWKRSLWERAGGKLITGWAFDTELWTRFFQQAEHYQATAPLGAFRKGQQSKSVSQPSSFLNPSMESIAKMKKEATAKIKKEAMTYRAGKIFSRLLALIPDRLFIKIPLLKKFAYKLLEYSFQEDKWLPREVNPFKNYRI